MFYISLARQQPAQAERPHRGSVSSLITLLQRLDCRRDTLHTLPFADKQIQHGVRWQGPLTLPQDSFILIPDSLFRKSFTASSRPLGDVHTQPKLRRAFRRTPPKRQSQEAYRPLTKASLLLRLSRNLRANNSCIRVFCHLQSPEDQNGPFGTRSGASRALGSRSKLGGGKRAKRGKRANFRLIKPRAVLAERTYTACACADIGLTCSISV